jgi:hypothetical protein
VTAGKKMAIVVNYQPPDVPLNIRVIQQPGLAKILDLNFTHRLFTNFVPSKDGMDNIMITNLGTKQVQMLYLAAVNFLMPPASLKPHLALWP